MVGKNQKLKNVYDMKFRVNCQFKILISIGI